MMWFYLSISKFFNKIGNYFYYLHVKELRIKQKKDSEKLNKPYCKKCVTKYATTEEMQRKEKKILFMPLKGIKLEKSQNFG